MRGIVQEVAKDFYDLDVEVKKAQYNLQTNTKLPHHYVFEISAKETTDDNLKREFIVNNKIDISKKNLVILKSTIQVK